MKNMKSIVKTVILYRRLIRLRIVWSYYKENLNTGLRWVNAHTETDNFYYALDEENLRDLESMISVITNSPQEAIHGYMDEISSNLEIQKRISESWEQKPGMRDSSFGLARRVGWYAVIRAVKPKLVVETGVSHGVGLLVICAALEQNIQEGFEGNYIGTDINPDAGELILEKYRNFAEILIGDSLSSLRKMTSPIGVFINDSDHSSAYEGLEYEEIRHLLLHESVILGDNSHVTNELRNFSQKHNRKFLFFREKPRNHWYPGAGIGFSFN